MAQQWVERSAGVVLGPDDPLRTFHDKAVERGRFRVRLLAVFLKSITLVVVLSWVNGHGRLFTQQRGSGNPKSPAADQLPTSTENNGLCGPPQPTSMLRLGAAILSPLRPKFDNGDQAQTHGRQSARLLPTPVYTSISGQDYEPNEAPEDFARDAKMELMRRATDDLKTASQDAERFQVRAQYCDSACAGSLDVPNSQTLLLLSCSAMYCTL